MLLKKKVVKLIENKQSPKENVEVYINILWKTIRIYIRDFFFYYGKTNEAINLLEKAMFYTKMLSAYDLTCCQVSKKTALFLKQINQFDEAHIIIDEHLALIDKIQNIPRNSLAGIVLLLRTKASLFESQEKFNEAEEYYEKGLQISRNNQLPVKIFYSDLCSLYRMTDKTEKK